MRFGKKDMSWVEPYEQSFALVNYIKAGTCRPQKLEEHWHRTFNCVAKFLGFNRATRKVLWNELVCGNWERLHTTEEENERTPEEWADELCLEVSYCSDRWSLDRLTRCHWLYRQYMSAKRRERDRLHELGIEVPE